MSVEVTGKLVKKPRTPTANGTSCLDVASPGVNFLMKSDKAVLNTFQENINTLQQTSQRDIPSAMGVLRFGKLSINQ